MKKQKSNIIITILIMIIIMLLIFLSLIISGKIKFDDDTINKEQNEITEEQEKIEDLEEIMTFDIKFKDDNYNTKNSKGYSIVNNKRNLPEISSNKYQEQANKIVKYLTDISNKFWDDTNKQSDDITKDMDNIDKDMNLGVTYIMDTSVKKDNYVSFKLQLSGALGGVSWDNEEGYNFNILTGEVLNFSDITNNYNNLVNVTFNEMVKYISSQEYASNLENNWQEILKNEIYKIGNWYFVDEGIKFCIDKYSIGPGYIGVISNIISYDIINEYLNEEYRIK